MSNLIRCDWCEKELSEDHSSYLTLERGGLDLLTWDEEPGPWHFDTWGCLSRFAFQQDQPMVGVDEG